MEETGEEKKGVRVVEKKREEAKERKGEVEVKGVKRPPRAQRKFWGGKTAKGRGKEGEEKKGKGRLLRRAAPREIEFKVKSY